MDLSDLTIERIGDLCTRGHKRLEFPRMARKYAYEALAGRHYFNHTNNSIWGVNSKACSPLNLTAQQIRTLLPYIGNTAGNPEVEPRFGDLELEANLVEAEMEYQSQMLRLDRQYLLAGIDATLTGVCFSKVSTKETDSVIIENGRQVDKGQTYQDILDFDDYFPDPDAKTRDKMRIEGHRQVVERMDLLNTALGHDPARDGAPIHPAIATPEEAADMVRRAPDIGGRVKARERVSSLSEGAETSAMNEGLVEVVEMYVFRGGKTACLQFLVNSPGTTDLKPFENKLLRAWIYDGPERSPLEDLCFMEMPNNILPLSLEQMQRDLAIVADTLAMKFIRQLLRAKTVPVVSQSHSDLGGQMAKAADGWFLTGDPRQIGAVKFEAQSDQFVPGVGWVMEQWNNVTGNLQLASGQGDVGETATEFSGLMGRVTGWLQFLQSRMADFQTRCLQRRARLFLGDPMVDRMIPLQTPRGTIAIPYNRDMRAGGWNDFAYKVREYSTQVTDPAVQMRRIVELFSQVLPAIMNAAMTGMIEPRKALRVVASKYDMPELEQMLLDPQAQMQMAALRTLGPSPQSPPPSSKLAMGKMAGAGGGGPEMNRPIDAQRSALSPGVPAAA